MPAVGFLSSYSPPKNLDDLTRGPIHQGMGETGYIDGQNMTWEYRWAEGHYDRLPALAADLVSRKVDVIIAVGGSPPTFAAKSATSTIPIVFTSSGDPVGVGLVASLARPGGNVTGFSNISSDLAPKQLDLLSQLVPQAGTIALLVNPSNQSTERTTRGAEEAARVKSVKLEILKATNEDEIDAAFASLAQLQVGALIVDNDAALDSRREQLVALASRYAVPAIYGNRLCVAAGGLISYGIDLRPVFQEAGKYAGRILKGEKPADMPIQQPTKFLLVINPNTAKALGITIPQSVLAGADEVIE
jgi:putative ABC transport system substrate-binding protein